MTHRIHIATSYDAHTETLEVEPEEWLKVLRVKTRQYCERDLTLTFNLNGEKTEISPYSVHIEQ